MNSHGVMGWPPRTPPPGPRPPSAIASPSRRPAAVAGVAVTAMSAAVLLQVLLHRSGGLGGRVLERVCGRPLEQRRLVDRDLEGLCLNVAQPGDRRQEVHGVDG